MQFTEEKAAQVKAWVVKRLEDISDADSDVLADYVLALIQSDAPDDEIRQASIENLEDFLKENTVRFVDEIFAKYAPKTQPSAPSVPQQAQTQPPPIVHSATPFQQPGTLNPQAPSFVQQTSPQNAWGNSQNSRKRTFNEGFQQDNPQGDAQRGGRSFKTPRTRRGGGRGDRMNGRGRDMAPNQFPQNMPGFPAMPQAFPGFDQNDPMAAMMALQSMGFPPMPGIPPMPVPGQQGDDQAKSNEPCPFYESNGICYMGAACPYKHGQGPVVVPSGSDEYDPTNSSIYDVQGGKEAMRGSDRGRGRGRGRGDRGGPSSRGRGGRSEFSHVGPSDDKTNTTIVVENIPEDKYQDQVIREYFSEFGNIAEINMQGFKKNLAVIKFENHDSAHRAWSSPKAIFDNRFVKVYWHKIQHKPDASGHPAAAEQDTPMFDKEEFEKQQAEAQKLHEERMQKRKEAEEARLALDKQREELMRKQQEEKAKLLKRLGDSSAQEAGLDTNGSAMAGDDGTSEQTKSLRAQLAALEAEAKSLGIDPDNSSQSFRGRGRGLGGYRGRGRGFDPSFRGSFRGTYRGRGAPRGSGRGGVLRLDNRPKRVAISGVDFNSEKDEALRQYLIGVGEYESIEPNPDRPDSLIVAFKERYLAEKLMFGPAEIPSVGKVELSWVANTPITSAVMPTEGQSEDTTMENAGSANGQEHAMGEVDYDVADDEDSWGIGL
ncbi:hypothetical protein UA08_06685 [Talaromyces atroroseus]|uniref:C3H1-type domain-containing protein n=1 Tax=Talaromyces atroroseus TaxID=1441469 RepID=A0A225AAX3_TALAT|nr:hypothetical protein UA08_06685 [Talaromyces atroroseus]OKL58052.1 hypothetical protein UA08_06685 [Talaromyces atroroseus]